MNVSLEPVEDKMSAMTVLLAVTQLFMKNQDAMVCIEGCGLLANLRYLLH